MKILYAIIAFCLLISYTTISQTISSNAPLCGNANLTLELTATGGTTYAWKGPNSFTSTQQKPSIKSVNYRNRGVYTVTVDSKTTLTTDVNIKDPVAFTVPKEISVCEGGTLLIEPKSGRLTDSTEVLQYTSISTPSGDYFLGSMEGFNVKNVGTYTIIGEGIYGGNGTPNISSCPTTKFVNVKLRSSNCKTIEIEDLSKKDICFGQDISIPFTLKGDFKKGTKFKVYLTDVNDFFPLNKKPNAIVEQSPATFKFIDDFVTTKVVIIADDVEQTFAISNKINPSKSGNYIQVINQVCDSISLKVNNTYGINSFQWFVDNKEIKNANSGVLSSKASGNYTFKYRDSFYPSCLYESQPVKIELGKIEKPYAYVNNDIELCVGKPATLNVSSKANTNYRWKKDGNYIANATNTTYQTLQEGKYQIEAKEGTCTAVSDTLVLKKPLRLSDKRIILGLYNDFTVPYSYDDYSKQYSVCNSFFNLYSDQLPTSNIRYQWFRDNIIIANENDYILKSTTGGVFFAKLSYGSCETVTEEVNVKFSKMLRYSIYPLKNIESCLGSQSSVIRMASGFNRNTLQKGYIYKDGVQFKEWSSIFYYSTYSYTDEFTVKESGKYYAVGKLINSNDNSECLIATDTVSVNVVPKINNSAQIISQISCKDTTNLSYKYSPLSGREIAYKWTKDGVVLKQDSSSTFQATQAGIYQLETTYKGGCTVVSSPYKVEFGKIGVNFYSYGDLTSPICEGSSKYLYSSLTENPDKSSYDFTKDGKTINTTLQNAYILTQSGTYKLKVTNGKCEGTSPDFTLKVDKIPTSITPSDSVTFCAGKTVELKTSTEAGLSYIWERNGSVISQANQANYTANADGLYKATLLRGACFGITPSVKLKSLANIIPTATLTGDKKIDYDTETKLSINLTSHAPWTFKLSDGKEYTATKSPFEASVKPLSTTTYSVTEVKNICGTGTVSGTAKIEIIILSAEEEKELNVEVFPIPSSEICHWKIETPQATNASVIMVDVLGITQYSQASATRTQTHEGTIDLTNMKAGTYFLKFQAGEKSVVRKVMKY